ncbi:MAG: prolyl oligopeptidase family serine peptidase [Verrucomicrobiales bacterium]|nr:prolyl oligopeptidase family serine peptidase [Verrucomicrobiales bacterium]
MKYRRLFCSLILGSTCLTSLAEADGASDNLPDQVRPIPPLGIEVPADQVKALTETLHALEAKLSALRTSEVHHQIIEQYLPDVEVCARSVRDALQYNEFFKPAEISFAGELLKIGQDRAAALADGKTPWTKQTGPVIRGYRSRIDGSAQPYGLEIPEDYDFHAVDSRRLDFWFHGRGETLSEVSFLQQRSKGQGSKISPPQTIVLHPYGRYSNANKFAGEVDLFEALAHAKRDYRIDDDRILVRGFSMGGAACWQFAVHFPDLWAAAQPGAGFSETPDFLKTFQGETLNPTWWEEKLWRWYDATNWAVNLTNYPTIAYSGEIDRQKQAADQMVAAAEKAGFRLLHLIGPKTAHAIHPETLQEIETRLAEIAKTGRTRVPSAVRFSTFTLRYHQCHWVSVDKLEEHWEEGRIDASLALPGRIVIATKGIRGFSLHFQAGDCPLDPLVTPVAILNGKEYDLPKTWSDRSWEVYFHSEGDQWSISDTPFKPSSLSKKTGLQGPIDDAFLDSFLIVSPSGKPQFDLLGEWQHSEETRAVAQWRKQFRGDARVKKDTEMKDSDLASHHLILWGDPSSNSRLRQILDKLPIRWTKEELVVAGKTYDPAYHTLAMIYPNPENPDRYVVLNSGFTFREYDYLNNARQTPKLPDWAVIDLREAPSSRFPGKVVAAGFFDEQWQFKTQPEK